MGLKDVLRKLLLCPVLFASGPLLHLQFGHGYEGPGMNQIDVLIVVFIASVVLTTLFALLVMAAGLLLRHKTEGVRFVVDAVLFLVFLVLNAIGGLTARVS